MSDSEHREPPTAPAGWLLMADHRVLDIDPMIEATGQVYRYPIAIEAHAAAMAPGQPCFLLRIDRAKVVGLWAVGEVVGPCAPLDESDHAGDDGPRWCAEVELLPLEKVIARTKLVDDAVLAASPVADATFVDSPAPLDRRQVRALESFDFWLVDPRPDQQAVLDAILAAEDLNAEDADG